jgi:2,3-bisphosphoglycerate-independent phosphoglycerate mutase
MKYIVLVGDGMSDRPLDELNGRTVLEVAERHYMDEIAKRGRLGTAITVPRSMTPASDVANLSILGYDPAKYYSGRGPLEAVNIGVDLREEDVAFRCNLITQADDTMTDYSAGHIKTPEARILMKKLDEALGNERMRFYPGISYRHLMVMKTSSREEALSMTKIRCTPPHDIIGQSVSKHLPQGDGREVLIDLMNRSRDILESHDVNRVRIDLGENPGNMIWLWGQGVMPVMPTFRELYGIEGSIISAVDLIKGIGKIIGLDAIEVPGATGYYDTNFKGKGKYALKSLETKDFVFVHVEAADEAGHNGDIRAKITAIENFDKYVVGTIWEAFKNRTDFKVMLLPDHATPISVKTHTSDPIPFAVCGHGVTPDEACVFTEAAAQTSPIKFEQGHLLMSHFIKGT